MTDQINSIGVIGAGAWGTALAQTMALAGRDVIMWAYEADTIAEINSCHTNQQFLPGIALEPSIRATADLAEIARQDAILLVPPAQFLGRIATDLAPSYRHGTPIAICAKGIEQTTGNLLGDVLSAAIPGVTLAVLSGPSFAADVARGLPAALTIASLDKAVGERLAQDLGYRQFRLYWSADVLGVQLGGAIKNVLAIAAGIVDGKQLGASAHAALVARGFAELRRFASALGAQSETLMGLSGLGDLLLTCGSPQSRNMSLGRALGQGKSLTDILGGRKAVTEGVYTAAAVARIAAKHSVEMPICSAVHAIVEGHTTVDDAIEALLSRPMRAEL